jgi:hypothetical protein
MWCVCRFPRPVHHRIPNFVDAEKAAARLAQLPEFQAAAVVKVNPDTPQKMVSRHVCTGWDDGYQFRHTHLFDEVKDTAITI